MDIREFLVVTGWLCAAMTAAPVAGAQDDEAIVREQLEQMSEMMENSGLTQEQLRQVQAVMHGVVQQGAQYQQAQDEQATQEFDATTAGFGSAVVTVDGTRHELRVIKCETIDSDGAFVIEAQKGPDRKDGHLGVSGAGRVNNSYVDFWVDGGPYESDPTAFDFDGQTLEWEGTVLARGSQRTPLSLSVTCRQ